MSATDLYAFLTAPSPIAVVACDPHESLMAASLVALSFEARGRAVSLVCPSTESAWFEPLREWIQQFERALELRADRGDAEALVFVGTGVWLANGARLPSDLPDGATRVAALVGLGAERAFGHDAREPLAQLTAQGGLLGVDPVLRYSAVARNFIELVEHVHATVGPMQQSVVADSVRAALFGCVGERAVSLTTRERPPLVGPETSLIWYFDPAEVL